MLGARNEMNPKYIRIIESMINLIPFYRLENPSFFLEEQEREEASKAISFYSDGLLRKESNGNSLGGIMKAICFLATYAPGGICFLGFHWAEYKENIVATCIDDNAITYYSGSIIGRN